MLQVIYELPDERPVDVYVGQQMDVYLKAAKAPKGISLDTDSTAIPFDEDDSTSATPRKSRTS